MQWALFEPPTQLENILPHLEQRCISDGKGPQHFQCVSELYLEWQSHSSACSRRPKPNTHRFFLLPQDSAPFKNELLILYMNLCRYQPSLKYFSKSVITDAWGLHPSRSISHHNWSVEDTEVLDKLSRTRKGIHTYEPTSSTELNGQNQSHG